jgi:hypothetical protein
MGCGESHGTSLWSGERTVIETYRRARERHAALRQEAYSHTRDAAVAAGICGPALRLADIDDWALLAWRETWTGRHPSGAGGWNWPRLVERLPHRPAIMPLAIWHGDDLCGLALGHLSRRRTGGRRLTVTVSRIERRPEPPLVPLRGQVAVLAIVAARSYGSGLGARQIRLTYPDSALLGMYQRLGFRVVWKAGLPLHCEQEIVWGP